MEMIDTSRFLPYGLTLEDVLLNPNITDAKLREVLRQRGVFIENFSDQIIPFYLSSLISPNEFYYFSELLRTKEDREKKHTEYLTFDSDRDLIQCVPPKIKNFSEHVKQNLRGVTLTKHSNFSQVKGNPNLIEAEFECETLNHNSSWYRHKNRFSGKIQLEKDPVKKRLKIKISTTSKEIGNINSLAIQELKSHFDKKGYTTVEDEVQKITFDLFSNEERCAFLLSLASNSKSLTLKGITNIGIAPDDVEELSDDAKKLMSGDVNSLIIRGENLSKNFLLDDKSNFKSLELATIEVSYEFELSYCHGTCKILYGFDKYFPKKDKKAQFKIDIVEVKFDKAFNSVNQRHLRDDIFAEFDLIKEKELNKSQVIDHET